jgi:Alginate lyase
VITRWADTAARLAAATVFAATCLWQLPALGAAEPPHARIALGANGTAAVKAAVASEAAASRAFASVKSAADSALGEKPSAVERIVSEGRLHSDPEKKRSLAARRDLPKIEALGYTYALTGQSDYGQKARAFIVAWARTYASDGNPINETEFVRLMRGYDLVRGLFSTTDQAETDGWLLRLADEERKAIRPGTTAAENNHMSHRLKIIGHVAYLLADDGLRRWTTSEYRRHVERNLNRDGSTFDFHQRDALHYHVYDVLPLLELCLAAEQNGDHLYAHTTSAGATLENAIAFLIPYVEGEKTHREFVGSTVKFDRERSAAGDPTIRIGALWNAEEARRLFDLAGYFSPRFHAVKFPGGEKDSFERLLAQAGRAEKK